MHSERSASSPIVERLLREEARKGRYAFGQIRHGAGRAAVPLCMAGDADAPGEPVPGVLACPLACLAARLPIVRNFRL